MFETILQNVARKTPLIHCITNYVTVNDCANILLACGGSPIMADDAEEAADITSICDGLLLNLGTLNARTVTSMRIAGQRANALSHPVVLDPVGVGASSLRTRTANTLLRDVQFAVIRGNSSEIRALSQGIGSTKGVDADIQDATTENNLPAAIENAKYLCGKTGAVIAVTGAIDIVTNGRKTHIIRNGHPMMSKISGTGCMLTAVIAAYCAANPDNLLDAAAAAVCAMGLCGELAHERTRAVNGGTATLRIALMDAMSRLDAETLAGGLKLETR